MSGSTEQHDPDYLAFIQEKVAIARGELAADKGIPGAEVERRFAALRATAAAKISRAEESDVGSS